MMGIVEEARKHLKEMESVKIKRTISYPEDQNIDDLVSEILIGNLPHGDQVRVGFEKGTLEKAEFTTVIGTKIIYESLEE